MKFYYSLLLIVLNTLIFFWLFVFLIPTPKLVINKNPTELNFLIEKSRVREALQSLNIIKEDKKEIFRFEKIDDSVKYNAIFLYSLLTFGFILLFVILFHKKSFILFPLITSLILVLAACISLWLFTNSISYKVYLDIQMNRESFGSLISAVKFLGVFVFLELVSIIFGLWYKFPEYRS